MSDAVKILQGRFGRVALLDMNAPLVGHAHHHCHILIKAGGADSAFSVRGELAPLTDDTVVLVNAWEHHAYEHRVAPGERTVVLALYIEPSWLAELQRSLALSGHPRFPAELRAHHASSSAFGSATNQGSQPAGSSGRRSRQAAMSPASACHARLASRSSAAPSS